MSTPTSETQCFHHGRLRVKGGVLPDAITAYRTYGDSRSPCIVFPTCYGAKLDDQMWLIGPNKALDPSRYFIVTFALFSNGESSSPSNTEPSRAQHAVLTKALGITHVLCAIGFSMGGQQAYYWAVVFPDFLDKFVCLCGSAKTSPHNKCFLEGPKAALVASKDFDEGHYKSPPYHGLRAFGRVYSAWGYGQTWYREHQYLYGGKYPDLNSFLREEWEDGIFKGWDANDLLTLLETWSTGDVSQVRDGGDFHATLKSIKAKGLIMPSKTDLYFTPEDNEIEVSILTNSRLAVIDSVWGHFAGFGYNEKDDAFIHREVSEFLKE
ncbi:hypothetical protein ONZ45_g4642 [Pleurotus djamor]|nr:hypothetical protein ONZ45_g4642 [Pleurotus djamor]